MAFNLNLEVSSEELVAATFSALLAAAWSKYSAALMMWGLVERAQGEPPMRYREMWAQNAFIAVVGLLPENNPFAKELLRYLKEEVPLLLKDAPLPEA